MKKTAKRKAVKDSDEELEDYEQDNSEIEEEPPKKSRKSEKAKAKPVSKGEEEKAPPSSRTAKKPKLADDAGNDASSSALTDKDGSKYFDLGKKKRATVREFKGTLYLDIREFYEQGGEEKPGKKGISLTQDQWSTLKTNAVAIDTLFTKAKK